MKIYAIRYNNTGNIVTSWNECLKLLDQYPSAEYKSFYNIDEAKAFIKYEDFWTKKINNDLNNNYCIAFTDGSYDDYSRQYSYGVLIILSNYKEIELSGVDNNKDYVSSRNIAGELFGAIRAINWAIVHSYKKIKIYYDYEGIEKWALNKWQAKSKIAKMYISEYKKLINKIDIVFEKVKSHNGNEYNEKADRLARLALCN